MAFRQKLNESTLIPVGLAIIVIGGGAGWLTKMDMTMQAHAARISAAEDRFDELTGILNNIDRRLAGIEGELKRIRR